MLLESGHICFLKSQGMNYELIALTYLYKANFTVLSFNPVPTIYQCTLLFKFRMIILPKRLNDILENQANDNQSEEDERNQMNTIQTQENPTPLVVDEPGER